MVENGVPHGDGLRRTHTGRWKTLRLAVILGFRHETDKKMEKNHRALDAGRWWCYNREGCESGSVPGSTHMGNPGLIVLNYHRVGDCTGSLFDHDLWSASAENFEEQVRFLSLNGMIIILQPF